ncbi:unnamed protein product, partial [Gongylonema pulchrum]|uniref:NR LBD domain-containing protein n=1 Tax=Gongylonema pulchrum TaxID=637853 RepID=A0A183DPN5_9BILA
IQFERDSIGSTKRRSEPPIAKPSEVNGTTTTKCNAETEDTSHCISRPLVSGGTLKSNVIDTLMEMEARTNQEMTARYRNSVITSSTAALDNLRAGEVGDVPSAFSLPCRACTVDDLNELSRTTLVLMVDWAKGLEPFTDLIMDDKIILLKNYAPQHLILVPAFRSPDTTRVCLFNNTYMSREQSIELEGLSAFKTSNITPRVLDEIVWPMRQLQMREEEFVCLKALAFLHPEAKGLSVPAQTVIREARNRVLKALYCYVLTEMPEDAPTRYGNILLLAPALKALAQAHGNRLFTVRSICQYFTDLRVIREARNRVLKALYCYVLTEMPEDAPTRYGNILLLAPALKALAQLLIENMTLTKFFGLAEVDSLLSEFILDSPSDLTQPSLQQRFTSSYFLTSPTTTNTSCSDIDAQRIMTIL